MAETLTLPLDPQEPDPLRLVCLALLHAALLQVTTLDALVLVGPAEGEE